MDQNQMEQVWVKSEPIDDDEPTVAYLNANIKCEEELDIEPFTEADIKSETDKHLVRTEIVSTIEKHSVQKCFECKECGREFSLNRCLMKHMRTHSGLKCYPCDICGMGFTRRPHLKLHLAVHFASDEPNQEIHGDETVNERYECVQGNEGTKNLYFPPAGEKSFECDICGKRFLQRAHVESHRLRHTTNKLFTCDECDKSFISESRLKTHKFVHTASDSLQYACEKCEKSFATQLGAARHRKMHIF